MKSTLLAAAVAAALTTPALAAERCYRLSLDPDAFSRTPETLCVEDGQGRSRLTLTVQEVLNPRRVGTLELDLLSRARCLDCNADVYGVANPSNSVFNQLRVVFDGRMTRGGGESGTVAIGATSYYYESL